MTNKPAANQSNTAKEKEESQRDDNTDVAYKDAGHCSRSTHNLLLGLTVLGTQERSLKPFPPQCILNPNLFN